MKNKRLLEILGDVDDRYIEEADPIAKKTSIPRWAKWASAIAACLVLAVGVGGVLLPRMSGSGTGGSGHEEGSVFMSYAGPVFPLTLREENDAISARRIITMDFAPWIPVWISNEEEAAAYTGADRQRILDDYNAWYPEGGRYESSGNILVTDSYTLTNDTAGEQTVHVLYPFASSMRNLKEDRPNLNLDGTPLETALHAGSYAGGFEGAWENGTESGENPGSLNLDELESWEGYRDLLSDGTYLQRALGEYPDLSDIPVTVYEFSDAWGPEPDDDADMPNPTIRILFDIDFSKTGILTCGSKQGMYDRENGQMGAGFSIGRPGARGYGEPCYLIVTGEDIRNVTCQGYATGGFDTKKTIEAGVTVTRTLSSLEDALRTAAKYHYQNLIDMDESAGYEFELYFGLLKEQLVEHGVLSEHGAERYADGAIESLDVETVSRVFWLEAEVTIPAGSSVTLEAEFEKKPSYDFFCSAEENNGISGYDLVTRLGSSLSFTGQTAKLEDRGQVAVVRQNFGFDLVNGVTEVPLTEPHYYLEVRSVTDG